MKRNRDHRWVALVAIVGLWLVIVVRFLLWLPADRAALEAMQTQIAQAQDKATASAPASPIAPQSPAAPGGSELPPIPPFPVETLEPAVRDQITEALAAVDRSPQDAAANGRLGMLFHAYQVRVQAEAAYQRATILDPQEVKYHYYRGLVLYDLRRLDEAAAEFDQVLSHWPQNLPAVFHKAEVDLARGRLDEAEAGFRAVLIEPASAAPAFCSLADISMKRGRPTEAAEFARRAVELAPAYGKARYLLGRALQKLGREDEAGIQLERAEKERNTAPTIQDPLQAELDRLATGAIADLHEGIDLLRAGRLVEAMPLLKQAVAANPDLPEAHANLGTALLQTGALDEAETHLRRATELNPSYVQALYNLGVVARRRNDLPAARRHFEAALSVDPEHFESRFGLGVVEDLSGDRQAAARQFADALRLRPDDARSAKKLADALASLGRFGECIDVLRRTRQRLPNDASVSDRLAWFLATCPDDVLRRPQEALELAQGVQSRTGDREPMALDTLAAAQAACGDFASAVQTAELAIAAAKTQSDRPLAAEMEQRLALYRERQPYRLPPRGGWTPIADP